MSPAAELHRLFTTHLCRRLRHSAARRELCVSPDWRIPAVQAALAETELRAHWNTVLQGEGDLGRRMTRWMTRNLTETHFHCILIGADCPTLGDHDIQQAIELLDRHDVVLGPALDGGYYLIGLRGPWDDRRRRLFQSIPWSGPDVLERTVDRAAADQLSLAQLPGAEDIDTLRELNRLIDRLRHSTSPSDGHLLGEIQRALESSHPIPPSQPDTSPVPPSQPDTSPIPPSQPDK